MCRVGQARKLRTLHGWSSTWTAKILAPFKDYLLAFDVTKNGTHYPHMMKWGAAAVPGAIPHSWDSTDIDPGRWQGGHCRNTGFDGGCSALGDAMIVYKERSMYAVRYVGYPSFLPCSGFWRLWNAVPWLWRDDPLGHVVLTAGDVVLNTGSGAVHCRWDHSQVHIPQYRLDKLRVCHDKPSAQ